MADAAIISLALTNKQNLEGALRISANAEDIRNGVLRPFLHAVETGLTHLADEKGPDWEVRGLRGDWPKGQWSDNPSAKWLPILLRRRCWPNMVGAAIQADSDGPRHIKTGIGAVTEHAWVNDKQSVPYYGEPLLPFIGPASRNKLIGAVEAPPNEWWSQLDRLTDDTGRDISNWTDVDTVLRIYRERDSLCDQVVRTLGDLAEKIDNVKPDAT
jgi:hypothetical protein